MRRRRKQNHAEGPTTETYIGPDTNFKGTVVAGGSLRIDGEVNGQIQADGDVVVGETGRVQAEIQAANVIVAGTVTGEVRVTGRLELLSTGRLHGDATMETLIVEQGGVLQGSCRMGTDGYAAATHGEHAAEEEDAVTVRQGD